jgi:hypothetical protein
LLLTNIKKKQTKGKSKPKRENKQKAEARNIYKNYLHIYKRMNAKSK